MKRALQTGAASMWAWECAGELRANGREPEAGAGVHLGVVRQRGERRACGRRSGGALIVFKNSSSHRFRCAPAFLGFARLFISFILRKPSAGVVTQVAQFCVRERT